MVATLADQLAVELAVELSDIVYVECFSTVVWDPYVPNMS